MFIQLYMSCVTCHMSRVTYHVSPVTCHKTIFFDICCKKKRKEIIFIYICSETNWTMWWSQSVEGLLSMGPTLSSFQVSPRDKWYIFWVIAPPVVGTMNFTLRIWLGIKFRQRILSYSTKKANQNYENFFSQIKLTDSMVCFCDLSLTLKLLRDRSKFKIK